MTQSIKVNLALSINACIWWSVVLSTGLVPLYIYYTSLGILTLAGCLTHLQSTKLIYISRYVLGLVNYIFLLAWYNTDTLPSNVHSHFLYAACSTIGALVPLEMIQT